MGALCPTLNFCRNSLAARNSAPLLRLLGRHINPCKPFRSQSLRFCENGELVYFVARKSLLRRLLPTQLRGSGRSASYLAITI